METIENLFTHRSIRKYTEKPIEKEVLDKILEAGIRASNTGNMQIYSIIVTQDIEKKKALAKLHFAQKMVETAAAVITVCADVNRFHKWCELHNAEKSYDNFLWFLTGTIDATIVTQNICIAAEEMGLGICYLGTVSYNAPEICEFLKLPEGVIPVTCITIGYPNENPPLTDRLPIEGVVHYEHYADYSDNDITHIHKQKEELPESKNFVAINEVENLAQVFTQKRYPKAANVSFSQKLLKCLSDKGFMNQ